MIEYSPLIIFNFNMLTIEKGVCKLNAKKMNLKQSMRNKNLNTYKNTKKNKNGTFS